MKALTFHNYADKESLLEAMDVLREMNEADDALLPATFEDVPTEFVPAQWRRRVLNREGTVNRRDYEMCALSDLRDSLRSGAVWLEGSRQYANLDSYLIPKARWEQLRQTYCDMVDIAEDGAVQLELKQAALEENLKLLAYPRQHKLTQMLADGYGRPGPLEPRQTVVESVAHDRCILHGRYRRPIDHLPINPAHLLYRIGHPFCQPILN